MKGIKKLVFQEPYIGVTTMLEYLDHILKPKCNGQSTEHRKQTCRSEETKTVYKQSAKAMSKVQNGVAIPYQDTIVLETPERG